MNNYLPKKLSLRRVSSLRSPDRPAVRRSPAVANWEAHVAVQDRDGCRIAARNGLRRPIMTMCAAVGLLALLWASSHSALAQQEDVIASGRQLFNQKCAVCHGVEGKGDGVLGPHLKKQPADLSRLSKTAGGTFPFWEVYGKIDGREDVAAHGPRDMPVWGADELLDGTSGQLAREQILELVFFLQSIQDE